MKSKGKNSETLNLKHPNLFCLETPQRVFHIEGFFVGSPPQNNVSADSLMEAQTWVDAIISRHVNKSTNADNPAKQEKRRASTSDIHRKSQDEITKQQEVYVQQSQQG